MGHKNGVIATCVEVEAAASKFTTQCTILMI